MRTLVQRTALGATGFGITSLAALSGALADTVVAGNGPAPEPENVTVTGRRPQLDKLPEKILDTPQSINVVPLKVIQEQGTASLQDALRNVPGITLNSGEGGAHGDTVNLRGFSASDDFFLDGLRDTGFYTRDSFDYDAVEVYKGPASTLFGRGSTGGVINQVSKLPTLYPIESGIFTVGTNEEYRGTTDVNYLLGDDSALRIDLMGMKSHIADRDDARVRRWGAAPSVAFGLDTPTTFTLAYFHEYEDNVPDFGVPFLFGEPAPVKRDAYYGLPADDRQKTNVNIVTGTVKHDFANGLTLSDKARWGNYYFDTRQTSPVYGDANCYAGSAPWAGAPVCTGAAGEVPVATFNPLFPVAGMPLGQIFVLRDRPSVSGTVKTLMNDADASMKFTTGVLAHTLIAGVELDHEEADLTRYTNQDTAILPTPLLDPDPDEAFPGHQTGIRQRPGTSADTTGLYAVDTIDWGTHWSLVAALRWDRFDADFSEPVTHAHFHHTDYFASPRTALVYKPDENSSIYLSWGTSFNPSAENLSLSARNADLAPEKDHTFELGGKTQLLDGMLSVTAALFDTVMENARIADPLNPGLQTLSGELRENGFEADVAGNLTDRWEIVAGYTYLDGRSLGVFGTGLKGPVPNTAHNQADLWTTYDFDGGFKTGLGVNYLGRRAAFKTADGEVAHVPSYVTFDAMASYPVTDNVSLQLNGYNLFDRKYFSNAYFSSVVENHVVPGAGRTFTLSAIVNL
ncbi:MAG TPA: TonB-dependent siderophore receptor [Rhizomicrobium sp.]|nr:TonB-dependent siderophore receptor [Rhizomicrobium sp.]